MLTLGLFILKFLALGVVGLFFAEDLELTKDISSAAYATYFTLGTCSFIALFFFVLGKKLLWLIIFGATMVSYLGMYNGVPEIAEIHRQNDLKSRYFKDSATFISRMQDVLDTLTKDKK